MPTELVSNTSLGLYGTILSVKIPAPLKRSSILGYENKEIPLKFCEINYACISFSLQAKKQETKQSVKHDKRNGEDGSKPKVQYHSPGKIFKQEA